MSLKILGQVPNENKHAASVSSIFFERDRIFSGSDDGKLKIWRPDLTPIQDFDTNCGAVLSIACVNDTLYTCGSDETIQAWDKSSTNSFGKIDTTLHMPLKLFFEVSTSLLWAGDSHGSVAKFENGKEVAKYDLVEEIWDLIVTSDPTRIYTARDRDIVVTEIMSDKRNIAVVKATIEGRYPITVIDDKFCCLNREGRNIQIHSNKIEDKLKKEKEFPASELILNAMCPKGVDELFVGGYDGIISLWNIATGTCSGSLNLGACVNVITSAPDGAYVGLADGQVLKIG